MYAIVCAQRIKKGCSIVDLKAVKLRLDFIALDTKSETDPRESCNVLSTLFIYSKIPKNYQKN